MKMRSLEPNCECLLCGKPVHKKPSQLKKYKFFFCDKECQKQYKINKANRIELECAFCGKTIYKRRRQMKNGMTGNYFCDVLCKNRYLAKNRRWRNGWEDGNPQSHQGRKKVIIKLAANKCQACGFNEDVKLLDVHHYDKNYHNNAWSNLRCLCVMCHAKHHRCDVDFDIPRLSDDSEKLERVIKSIGKPKRLKKIKIKANKHTCIQCKKVFVPGDKTIKYCSVECASIGRRKAERPSKEELEEMIRTMTWVSIGKKYNISDNAIKKWAKNYGIIWTPRPYNKVVAPDA